MGNYNFASDLENSKRSVVHTSALLFPKFESTGVVFCDGKEYDLKFATVDGDITVEVKEDFMCKTTGNVFVEYETRGKESGIATTEADYFCYHLHRKDGVLVVLIPTERLKESIANKEYSRTVCGGDKGSFTKGYLYKADAIVAMGEVIEDG